MQYFVTGFLLLAGFFFWGSGLAMLVTPRAYRRFAFIFAVPAGLLLQSLVVWAGAHSGFCGTDSYGRASMALPASLLLAAIWRSRRQKCIQRAKFWPLAVLMLVQFLVMVAPLTPGSDGLATVTVGGNDAADYAAGARVFQKFSSHDRSGFMGQAEVVSIGTVDNFFDFWLRTNHFTPSALIALNGSMLGLKPYQLTGLLTITLLTATLPMVFWLARSGFGYRSRTSLLITTIYAFGPINWHAVYNVCTGQILAANAIALLTWCGLVLWRRRNRSAKKWEMTGLLLIAYGLILGSYNFIVVVCLVPVVAVAGGQALWSRLWPQFGRWLLLILVPLSLACLVFWERSTGIVERFVLLGAVSFGWYIPPMGPDGWLGILDGTWLRGYSGWLGVALMVVAGFLILWGVRKGFRRNPTRVFIVCATTLPILFGYAFLEFRAAYYRPNASYDAYKLFCVFYPGLLAGFCLWLEVAAGLVNRRWRMLGLIGGIVVVALNLGGEWRYLYRLNDPSLVADGNLSKLGQIEGLPNVSSINMRLADDWERLWANGFLLRKKQYFEVHTYEGRRATPLRGEWDLVGRFFKFDLPSPADSLHPVEGYTLVRRSSTSFMEAVFGQGWAEIVRDDPAPVSRTRWAAAETASIRLTNPQQVALSLKLHSTLRARSPRDCEIKIGDNVIGQLVLTSKAQEWTQARVVLPPGTSILTFNTFTSADLIGGRLKRPVTIAVDGLDVEVLADPTQP